MEKIKHQFRGPNTGVINHFKKHKQNYLFGMLGGFAIVKTFLFLFSFFGVINISGTFAQRGLELSSGNIQGYCNIGTNSCDLSSNGIVSIAPDTFDGYTNLQSIDLSRNQLTEINLSGLSSLRELYLDNNQLTEIDLSGLNSLQYLYLYNNQLTDIDLSGLDNLSYLELSNNQLTEIDLSGLNNLETLYLHNNQLTEIDLSGLNSLTYLDLDSNQLTEIDLSGLSSLTSLNLRENQLTEIDLSGLNNLETLYLHNNQLTGINLDGLNRLKNLYLHNNQLTGINLDGLNRLKNLYLYNNQLTGINLDGLNRLKNLYLYNNQLTEIDLSGLNNLEYLDLSNSQLTGINLDGLNRLKNLYLYSNQLTEINLSGLDNLSYLELSNNQLTEIDLSGLSSLTSLNLRENQLTEINLSGLNNLESLNLSYNKLYNLHDSDAFYNVTDGGYIDHNYLDVESIENDSDLVDMLDQKFNGEYGWRIQYLPMELSLSGNIVSVSDNIFTIDLEYHNSGARSSFDSAIYYDMVDGVEISTDTPYTTGYVGQTYGGFGDPCFDELYDSGTGAYVELLNNLSQAMEGMDALEYLREGLGYTGTAEDAGKFFINLILGDLGDDFFNMFSWNEYAEMLGIDLSSAPNCGTGGRNAYIFDLGNILSGNGGVISITGIYNGGYTGFENKIELLSTNKLSINVGTGDTNIALFYSGGNNETTPVVSNGGGGGYGLHKDVCPQNRDCSDSYYDGICGPCSLEERENQKQHGSADTQYLFQNKELFAQEVARVKSSTSNKYSNELFEAYVFAKDLGITTKETIDEAKLGDKLIRSHTAKMISNYAVKVMKTQINTGLKCEFTDMTDETQEMKNYAKLACQLGLMGIHNDGTANTVFNPEGELTRAEFGTVMSRLLRGNKYNGGKIYYKAHLNALKKEGIMTKIENPAMKELRGRVMLMLMRSFEK